MLIVVEKGKEALVEQVFEKWDLNCAVIGEVTEGGILRYYAEGELVAEVPAETLVLGGGAPVYQREYRRPSYHAERDKFDPAAIPVPADLKAVADKLVQSPNIASKRFIYKQYDSMVGINNVSTNAPADAAVVRIKGTKKALALTVDCNSRYVHADAYKGGAIAVSEAARNIVCSGGQPVAITNCLNFGNPYDPEVYWNFVHALQGMGDACLEFDTPVTGGNVSFYNQSPTRAVNPTPTIGMLGILEDISCKMTLDFKREGDIIYLIGQTKEDIGSSEYLVVEHGVTLSPAPHFDLKEEAAVQRAVSGLIRQGYVASAHDISEGGLFIAVLESAMPRGLGFNLQTDPGIRKDAFLFGESQSRIVVSVSPGKEGALKDALSSEGISFTRLGTVGGKDAVVDGEVYAAIEAYKVLFDTAIEKYFVAPVVG